MFLYFIPGNSCAVPKCLEYAFEGKTISRQQTMAGPCGSASGFLLANSDDPTRTKLDLPNQTWKRIPGIEIEAYCGVWNDLKITPSMVAREEMLQSHPVTFEDGSIWMCAVARGFDIAAGHSYSFLPRSLSLDPDSGKWVSKHVILRYRRFADLAQQYVEAQTDAISRDESTFRFDHMDELAILGLTANYKISSIELSFLEDAYSIKVRQELLSAILDIPTLALWQKKTLGSVSDGSGT